MNKLNESKTAKNFLLGACCGTCTSGGNWQLSHGEVVFVCLGLINMGSDEPAGNARVNTSHYCGKFSPQKER